MRKFRFRLETLLWHRRHLEDEMATLFREALAMRLGAERQLTQTKEIARSAEIEEHRCEPDRLRMRDLYLERLADRIAQQEEMVTVLVGEENVARDKWHEARRQREVVDKLREKARVRHRAEELAEEQREIDEWAVLRRGAAYAG